MEEVKLEVNDHGDGAFYLFANDQIAAKMLVGVFPAKLNVYHTEAMIEGKGYAKKLLETMVAYAREHNLKVIPYCPYVQAQFKRHPDQYADIWNQERQSH